MGRGGARLGAGRKPLRALEGGLAGGPLAPFEPRPGLSEAQRAAWDVLAPLALAARTLTPETQPAFRLVCQLVVLEADIATTIATEGLSAGDKAHPLLASYRGVAQRLEARYARFRLAPFGKPLVAAEHAKPKPYAAFRKRATPA